MALGYIDAHNHLQAAALEPYLGEIIPQCQRLGVTRMIVNAFTEADWGAVKQLAEEHPFVTPSYGLHPWYLKERRPGWDERLEQRLIADSRAHVGEVGLDLWMREPDLPVQIETFRLCLQIARRQRRVITIHCLNAWELLLDTLRSEQLPDLGFLLHAYSGPMELVAPFTELGAYFSFSGYFLNPGKENRLAPFSKIRADRLLAETDAPAMPLPESHRGFRLPEEAETLNHPGNIQAVYEGLGALLKIAQPELMEMTAQNSSRLFGQG